MWKFLRDFLRFSGYSVEENVRLNKTLWTGKAYPKIYKNS